MDRCLEAYVLWLMGTVMFTSNHGDTVDARYIGIAREIADARRPQDILQRSWGSAVLASTLRGMCLSSTRVSSKSGIIGCPLLLQLWSFERLPIGRPTMYGDSLHDEEWWHRDPIDAPTFGSYWTRRRVRF